MKGSPLKQKIDFEALICISSPFSGKVGSLGRTGGSFADGRVRHVADFHVLLLQRRVAAERRARELLVATEPTLFEVVGRRRRLRPVHLLPLPAARRQPGVAAGAATLVAVHHHLLRRGHVRLGKASTFPITTIFFTTYSQTALVNLQQMALLGFSYHLMLLRDQRDDMSLDVIRTHVSRVAPDWDL